MLLFDLEDYIPLIGTCPNTQEWEDMASTARATRDAYRKALNEWYLASTVCLVPSNPCYKDIKKQWDLVFNMITPESRGGEDTLVKMTDEFFSYLTDDNKIFNDEICSKYRKFMIDFRCAVKKLMRLVDGDPLTKSQWDYFYNRK